MEWLVLGMENERLDFGEPTVWEIIQISMHYILLCAVLT